MIKFNHFHSGNSSIPWRVKMLGSNSRVLIALSLGTICLLGSFPASTDA